MPRFAEADKAHSKIRSLYISVQVLARLQGKEFAKHTRQAVADSLGCCWDLKLSPNKTYLARLVHLVVVPKAVMLHQHLRQARLFSLNNPVVWVEKGMRERGGGKQVDTHATAPLRTGANE